MRGCCSSSQMKRRKRGSRSRGKADLPDAVFLRFAHTNHLPSETIQTCTHTPLGIQIAFKTCIKSGDERECGTGSNNRNQEKEMKKPSCEIMTVSTEKNSPEGILTTCFLNPDSASIKFTLLTFRPGSNVSPVPVNFFPPPASLLWNLHFVWNPQLKQNITKCCFEH